MYTILCLIYSTTLYVYTYNYSIVLMYNSIKYMQYVCYNNIVYKVLSKEVSNTLIGRHTSDNVDTRAK